MRKSREEFSNRSVTSFFPERGRERKSPKKVGKRRTHMCRKEKGFSYDVTKTRMEVGDVFDFGPREREKILL